MSLFKKNKKSIVVVVSGYFNPLHVGHIEMIKQAKKLGDKLVVIVNNDEQVKIKGSFPFMKEKNRVEIMRSLRDVDEVVLSIDTDASVKKTLEKINPDIFANGGDSYNKQNVPEYGVCKRLDIKMVDGLGDKLHSSSELIKRVIKK